MNTSLECPQTLILSRSEIATALSMAECIRAVEDAFALAARARMTVPPVVHIPSSDGAFHVKSAAYRSDPYYVAVKVNGNFPANPERHGLPTIQGAIVLSDTRTGSLLALMDSGEITALRTGAATAVAAKYLAAPSARTASVIGCGVQARVQLRMLLEVLPLERVFAFDTDPARAQHFASDFQSVACDVQAVTEFERSARQSDVIVTCTPSRRSFLCREHLSRGTFVAAVGADSNDKHEIDTGLLAESIVVADSIDQCAEIGELHHAIDAGLMTRDDVFAELGDIVAGTTEPAFGRDDIVVFDSTGIAIQDVAAAGLIYQRSIAHGVGTSLRLS